MRRQGQDVMQVNLAGIRRDIMNLAHNYSNAQVIMIGMPIYLSDDTTQTVILYKCRDKIEE